MKHFDLIGRVVTCTALTLAISACGDGSQVSEQRSASDAQRSAAQAQQAANAAGSAKDEALIAAMGRWRFVATDAKMITGGVNRYAEIDSTNEVDFDPPYSGPQHAHLIVRKIAGSDHFEVLLTIDRGQMVCADPESCTVAVKFDDAPPQNYSASHSDDGDSKVYFLGDDPNDSDVFEAALNEAKIVKIQPTVYQNGSPVFEFDVKGFTSAKLLNAVVAK